MRGTVDRLVPDEGFGFIIADNGQELFFHRSALESVDWDAIAPGTALEFDIADPQCRPEGRTRARQGVARRSRQRLAS